MIKLHRLLLALSLIVGGVSVVVGAAPAFACGSGPSYRNDPNARQKGAGAGGRQVLLVYSGSNDTGDAGYYGVEVPGVVYVEGSGNRADGTGNFHFRARPVETPIVYLNVDGNIGSDGLCLAGRDIGAGNCAPTSSRGSQPGDRQKGVGAPGTRQGVTIYSWSSDDGSAAYYGVDTPLGFVEGEGHRGSDPTQPDEGNFRFSGYDFDGGSLRMVNGNIGSDGLCAAGQHIKL